MCLDPHNKFLTLFSNSSPRLIKRYIEIIIKDVQDKSLSNARQIYSQILVSASFVAPKLLIKRVFPLLFSRLVNKRTAPLTDPQLEEVIKKSSHEFLFVTN